MAEVQRGEGKNLESIKTGKNQKPGDHSKQNRISRRKSKSYKRVSQEFQLVTGFTITGSGKSDQHSNQDQTENKGYKYTGVNKEQRGLGVEKEILRITNSWTY